MLYYPACYNAVTTGVRSDRDTFLTTPLIQCTPQSNTPLVTVYSRLSNCHNKITAETQPLQLKTNVEAQFFALPRCQTTIWVFPLPRISFRYHLNSSPKWSQTEFRFVLFRTTGSPPFRSPQTSPPNSGRHKKSFLSHAQYVQCSALSASSDTCTLNTNALDTVSTGCIDQHNTQPAFAVANAKIRLSTLSHNGVRGAEDPSGGTSHKDCAMTRHR